ncbi:hypothetical protein SUT380_21220 (plasmid) [Streptococcus parasuis]|nr:hypothetical protein SUT380_21220 [Streptococcus parasuis]
MSTKKTSQGLKQKIEKLTTELGKLEEQKKQILNREKELNNQIKTTKADYIVALMSESGKTIEELEYFVQSTNQSIEVGDSHVQNY